MCIAAEYPIIVGISALMSEVGGGTRCHIPRQTQTNMAAHTLAQLALSLNGERFGLKIIPVVLLAS